jgi:hypothetical protein
MDMQLKEIKKISVNASIKSVNKKIMKIFSTINIYCTKLNGIFNV